MKADLQKWTKLPLSLAERSSDEPLLSALSRGGRGGSLVHTHSSSTVSTGTGQERRESAICRTKRKKVSKKEMSHFNYIDGSKAECIVCKTKISYRAGSTNNLHRHLRTVHPTVPLEKRPVEPGINEGASVSSVTVAAAPAAAAVSTASFSSTPPQLPKTSTQSSVKQFLESVVDDKGFR